MPWDKPYYNIMDITCCVSYAWLAKLLIIVFYLNISTCPRSTTRYDMFLILALFSIS